MVSIGKISAVGIDGTGLIPPAAAPRALSRRLRVLHFRLALSSLHGEFSPSLPEFQILTTLIYVLLVGFTLKASYFTAKLIFY